MIRSGIYEPQFLLLVRRAGQWLMVSEDGIRPDDTVYRFADGVASIDLELRNGDKQEFVVTWHQDRYGSIDEMVEAGTIVERDSV